MRQGEELRANFYDQLENVRPQSESALINRWATNEGNKNAAWNKFIETFRLLY